MMSILWRKVVADVEQSRTTFAIMVCQRQRNRGVCFERERGTKHVIYALSK